MPLKIEKSSSQKYFFPNKQLLSPINKINDSTNMINFPISSDSLLKEDKEGEEIPKSIILDKEISTRTDLDWESGTPEVKLTLHKRNLTKVPLSLSRFSSFSKHITNHKIQNHKTLRKIERKVENSGKKSLMENKFILPPISTKRGSFEKETESK